MVRSLCVLAYSCVSILCLHFFCAVFLPLVHFFLLSANVGRIVVFRFFSVLYLLYLLFWLHTLQLLAPYCLRAHFLSLLFYCCCLCVARICVMVSMMILGARVDNYSRDSSHLFDAASGSDLPRMVLSLRLRLHPLCVPCMSVLLVVLMVSTPLCCREVGSVLGSRIYWYRIGRSLTLCPFRSISVLLIVLISTLSHCLAL
jgi:hypothetical protein